MYPLVQIGPFNLSSGGLLLLFAVLLANWLMHWVARKRGDETLADQADRVSYAALIGAVVGARLWYGLFNLDLYGRTPRLFWAVQVNDFAWPGALLGGMLAGWLWCRWRRLDAQALADCAALALPPAQALASVGQLLSGGALGLPTTLPWGVPLLGTMRHPTQIYFALAALLSFGALVWLARQHPPSGALAMAYLGLQGVSLLLVEALRADSLLLPGGIRAAQVFGLALLLTALLWARRRFAPLPQAARTDAAPNAPASYEQGRS